MPFFSHDGSRGRAGRTTTRTQTVVRDLKTGDPLYSSEEIVDRDEGSHPVITTTEIFGRYGCGHPVGEGRSQGDDCAECGLSLCVRCEEERKCVSCTRPLCRDHVKRLKDPATGQREPFCGECRRYEVVARIWRALWCVLTNTSSNSRSLISKD